MINFLLSLAAIALLGYIFSDIELFNRKTR